METKRLRSDPTPFPSFACHIASLPRDIMQAAAASVPLFSTRTAPRRADCLRAAVDLPLMLSRTFFHP